MTKKRGQVESVKAKVSRISYSCISPFRHSSGKKRCQKRWYGYVYRDREGLQGRCPRTQTNHKCWRDENHSTRTYLWKNEHICKCGNRFMDGLSTAIEEAIKEVRPQLEKIKESQQVKRRPKYPVKPKENK